MNVYFTHPTYLFCLFAIPFVILLHFVTMKMKRRRALKFANFDAIARVKGIDIYSKNIFSLIISILIIILIVFALAGLSLSYAGNASQSSIVIAIDSSRSMEANDLLPSRLEAAKSESLSFSDSLPFGTKVGVVSFSGNALIIQKLTNDKSLIKSAIDAIDFSDIGGTDINEAIVASSNILDGEGKKVVVMLSDGQLNVGTIEQAVTYAKLNDIIVYTIAVGTVSGGETSYGLSKVDEDSLKSIAYGTEGKYFAAGSSDELLSSLSEIADIKAGDVTFSLANYLLLASLALAIAQYFLLNSRYGSFP